MSTTDRIYLDNAATSWPKPEPVYAAVEHYQRNVGAAAGRGAYRAGQQADRVVAHARAACAELLGVAASNRVVFTSNGTDALNLAIHGVLRPGDHAIGTHCEHNSVLRPLEHARLKLGVEVDLAPINPAGGVAAGAIASRIRPETRLVCVTHGSNVTGAIQPIAEIVAAVRKSAAPGALVLVDAAQTAGHLPIDFESLDADLLATGGHKALLGPLGTGLLCLSASAAEAIRPTRQGGAGADSTMRTQPTPLPQRLEAGNLNLPALAGLAAAADWLLKGGSTESSENCIRQTRKLIDGLSGVGGVRPFGPGVQDNRLPVVAFSVEGYDPQEFAAALETVALVECRAGLHCAPLVHRTLESDTTGGLVRLSPGWSTTDEQIDQVIEAVDQLVAAFH
ncbi:MAG: aminotransferase class V-fold PLP-dependent enzyme [Planctomycetota bacterium]